MGSYRRKLEIIADILKVVSKDAKKTQIMYQANLSYAVLTKYLTQIRKACLIKFLRKERCYILTSKGKQFLDNYSEYCSSNKHVERQINDVQSKKKVLEELCSSGKRNSVRLLQRD